MTIDTIIKRNYKKTTFKPEKITNAILKAMLSVNNGELEDAERVTTDVENALLNRKDSISNYIPNVEEIIHTFS
jgi:ribonucleoside-diphosphate reductase beta chain